MTKTNKQKRLKYKPITNPPKIYTQQNKEAKKSNKKNNAITVIKNDNEEPV